MDIFDEDEIEMLDNVNDEDSDFFLSEDGQQNTMNQNSPTRLEVESPKFNIIKSKKFVKRYDQRIRKEWFFDLRLKNWLSLCPQYPKLLSCKFCKTNLTPKIYVLLKHAESKTHRFNITEEENRPNAIIPYSSKKKTLQQKTKLTTPPQLNQTTTPSVRINASPVKSNTTPTTNSMFLKFETNVCRVCLKAEGTVSLFGTDQSVDNFRFITFLEASENDGLPQSLCIQCSARLKIAYNFKTQAISSETQLKTYLKDINQSFSQISIDKATAAEDDEFFKDIEQLNALMDPKDKIELDKFETTVSAESSRNIKTENKHDINSFEVQVLFNDNNTDTTSSQDHLNNEDLNNDPLNVQRIQIKKRKMQIKKENDDDTDHECTICYKKFSTHSNLTRHKQVQHERNHSLYYCEICGKSFTANGSLKQHMTIHTGERPFECHICHVKFRRKNTLVQHMKTHEPDRPWGCKLCKQSFILKENLMSHLNRDHNKLAILYKCTQCDEKFQTKYALKDHAKKNHNSGDEFLAYDCKICEECFPNRLSYTTHMQIQHNLEEDTSTTSNFDIFTKNDEEMFQLPVLKEKFQCNECPFTFNNESDLLLHIDEHENESKPQIRKVQIKERNSYECRKCNKIFGNMENLFEHLKIHMEKFKCIYCDEMLLSKNILRSHIIKNHSDVFKEFNVCNYCDLTFITFDSYYDHIIKIHQDDESMQHSINLSNVEMES